MLDIIGNILELVNDLLFWRRKKKRRKFEKENNLPKKTMINPLTQILIGLLSVLIILKIITFLIK